MISIFLLLFLFFLVIILFMVNPWYFYKFVTHKNKLFISKPLRFCLMFNMFMFLINFFPGHFWLISMYIMVFFFFKKRINALHSSFFLIYKNSMFYDVFKWLNFFFFLTLYFLFSVLFFYQLWFLLAVFSTGLMAMTKKNLPIKFSTLIPLCNNLHIITKEYLVGNCPIFFPHFLGFSSFTSIIISIFIIFFLLNVFLFIFFSFHSKLDVKSFLEYFFILLLLFIFYGFTMFVLMDATYWLFSSIA